MLCGHQGHGKTTVARHLASRGFHRAPFAEPIRQALRATGVSDEDIARKDEPCESLGGRTPRDAMESLGAWGRAFRPDYWTRAWVTMVRGSGDPPLVVVDDARFDLETRLAAEWAAARGFASLLLLVTRPGHPDGTDHESNRIPALPPGAGGGVIVNSRGEADLRVAADAALRERGFA